MFLVFKIVEAIGLGLYSCVVLRFHSILVSRTKGNAVRFLLCLVAIAACVFLPFLGWFVLIKQSQSAIRGFSSNQRLGWLLLLYICWMGTFWIYAIWNRRVLNERLRPPKKTDPNVATLL
jgi:hypothetical protein